jgi:hypothetical protein
VTVYSLQIMLTLVHRTNATDDLQQLIMKRKVTCMEKDEHDDEVELAAVRQVSL